VRHSLVQRIVRAYEKHNDGLAKQLSLKLADEVAAESDPAIPAPARA
jgi:hypothetical protein